MNKNFFVVIPARLSSVRFPKKVLYSIFGKPMIIRVLENALKSNAKKVIVATDNKKIRDIILRRTEKNILVCMTCNTHQSGTERISEVINKYNLHHEDVIVNVQADEPFISSNIINKVANSIFLKKTNISTVACNIHKKEDLLNPSIVKVILNKKNYALYFSRAPIPFKYSSINSEILIEKEKKHYFHHIGIYAYRVFSILNYIKWGESPIEKIEMLEQLRYLWNEEKIYVLLINNHRIFSINEIKDIEKTKNFSNTYR
ncbi:MAG: 3-deoxy-manno-octulosonate cytidylyltransferase [Arsenophonus sp.]|nr:MAG: 3-deoxy-manno-octulosonate cytidylyltransferase [Arsenophonus sp.]